MGSTPPVKRSRRGMPQWQLETPKALRRGLGSPALFGIVQGFIAASVYFALGLVIQAALGFAWLVFVVSAVFFGLVVLSYVEGASLHQERGGATVIARYAFNELLSFIAGWAILLDYILLIAITAFATTDYFAVLFDPRRGRAVGVPVRRRGDRRRGVHEHPRRGLQALRAVRVRRARRPRAADDDRDPRAGAAAQPGRADRPREPRRHAVARGSALRVHADAGDVRRRRRVVGPGGRGRGRPQGAQAADDRAHARLHPLRRDRAGGGQRAAARGPAGRRRRRLRRGADARRGGRLRAGVAGRHAARADRHLGVRDPLHRLQRRDARALPARLLAGPQPPDPVGDRAPARDARDTGGGHRGRRAARDPAADPGRHRAPRRDLRVRRHDLVHDRAPVGDPAALARARPRPAVQDPGQPARRAGRAAGVGGARRGAVVRRLRRGHRPARRRPLGGRRLDGVRDRALRRATASPRASRSSSA